MTMNHLYDEMGVSPEKVHEIYSGNPCLQKEYGSSRTTTGCECSNNAGICGAEDPSKIPHMLGDALLAVDSQSVYELTPRKLYQLALHTRANLVVIIFVPYRKYSGTLFGGEVTYTHNNDNLVEATLVHEKRCTKFLQPNLNWLYGRDYEQVSSNRALAWETLPCGAFDYAVVAFRCVQPRRESNPTSATGYGENPHYTPLLQQIRPTMKAVNHGDAIMIEDTGKKTTTVYPTDLFDVLVGKASGLTHDASLVASLQKIARKELEPHEQYKVAGIVSTALEVAAKHDITQLHQQQSIEYQANIAAKNALIKGQPLALHDPFAVYRRFAARLLAAATAPMVVSHYVNWMGRKVLGWGGMGWNLPLGAIGFIWRCNLEESGHVPTMQNVAHFALTAAAFAGWSMAGLPCWWTTGALLKNVLTLAACESVYYGLKKIGSYYGSKLRSFLGIPEAVVHTSSSPVPTTSIASRETYVLKATKPVDDEPADFHLVIGVDINTPGARLALPPPPHEATPILPSVTKMLPTAHLGVVSTYDTTKELRDCTIVYPEHPPPHVDKIASVTVGIKMMPTPAAFAKTYHNELVGVCARVLVKTLQPDDDFIIDSINELCNGDNLNKFLGVDELPNMARLRKPIMAIATKFAKCKAAKLSFAAGKHMELREINELKSFLKVELGPKHDTGKCRPVVAGTDAYNAQVGPWVCALEEFLRWAWDINSPFEDFGTSGAHEAGQKWIELRLAQWLESEGDYTCFDASHCKQILLAMAEIYARLGMPEAVLVVIRDKMSLKCVRTQFGIKFTVEGYTASGEPDTLVRNNMINAFATLVAYASCVKKSITEVLEPFPIRHKVQDFYDLFETAVNSCDGNELAVWVEDQEIPDMHAATEALDRARQSLAKKLEVKRPMWEGRNNIYPFYTMMKGDDNLTFYRAPNYVEKVDQHQQAIARLGMTNNMVLHGDQSEMVSCLLWPVVDDKGNSTFVVGPKPGKLLAKLSDICTPGHRPLRRALWEKLICIQKETAFIPVVSDVVAKMLSLLPGFTGPPPSQLIYKPQVLAAFRASARTFAFFFKRYPSWNPEVYKDFLTLLDSVTELPSHMQFAPLLELFDTDNGMDVT